MLGLRGVSYAGILIFVVLGILFQNFSSASLPLGHDLNLTMKFDGTERTFVLHIPAKYEANSKIPLIIALHPSNGTGAGMERLTGFNAVADNESF